VWSHVAAPDHDREDVMAADPIDPHASPWHLFGAVMRRCRETEPKKALRRAADDLYIDFSNLAKWERGERTPPPEMIPRIDAVYGAHGVSSAQDLPPNAARRLITGQIIDALPDKARTLPAAQELQAMAAP
jgi:hypothetical protein